MTPAELRQELRALNLSTRAFARMLGRSRGVVLRWLAGTVPIPEAVAEWIARRRADPPPLTGRRQPQPNPGAEP